MKHPAVVGVLALVAVLGQPGTANAGLWAWLEEWSGPGPFKGFTYLFTACVQDGRPKNTPIANQDRLHTTARSAAVRGATLMADPRVNIPAAERLTATELMPWLVADPDRIVMINDAERALAGRKGDDAAFPPELDSALRRLRSWSALPAPTHGHRVMACGYFDQGFFRADSDPVQGWPELHLQVNDFGISARLLDGLDIGGGFGWVSFDAENGSGVRRRASITPIRVVVRPLLVAVPEPHRDAWMAFISVFYKETYVPGSFTGELFGAPLVPFESKGELIRSWGLTLDGGALFEAAVKAGRRVR